MQYELRPFVPKKDQDWERVGELGAVAFCGLYALCDVRKPL
jgi:hypothetical protein